MTELSKPELNVKEIIQSEQHISFYGIQLRLFRFSLIHQNSHPWVIPFHIHPTLELHYILSGRGQIQIHNTTFSVKANDVYVTLPFVPHQQVSSAEDIMEEYCLECTLSFSQTDGSYAEECTALQSFISKQLFSSCKAPPLLLAMLRQLEHDCSPNTSGHTLQSKLLSLECIVLALQELSSNNPDPSSQRTSVSQNNTAIKIKSYLDMNYRNSISVEGLAHLFYLSTKQLNRIFQKQYSVTIASYIKNLRFHYACRLMEQGGMSLREIALASGLTGYQQLHRLLQEQKKTANNCAPQEKT